MRPPGREKGGTVDEAQWQYLAKRYPEIRRSGTPSLARINGIGTTMMGRHDADAQSGAYIKTQVFTLLFVPLFAVAAYVVADAKHGWYFLGRVPLRPQLRLWNKLLAGGLAAFILGSVGWNYLNSPDFQMGRKLAAAEKQEQQGQLAEAIQGYQEVLGSNTGSSAKAGSDLEALLAKPAGDERPGLLRLAFQLKRQHKAFLGQDLVQNGLDTASAVQARDPRLALHLLDVVAEQPGQADKLAERRQALLVATVQAHPDDADAASRLALWHEQRGEIKEARALLLPVKDKLGAGEGARLLGRILAHEGQFDESYALLQPYTKEHLQALRQAESAYQAKLKEVWDRTIAELNHGQGPAEFFQHYKAASSEEQKQALLQQYVSTKIAVDGGVAAQKAQWAQAAKIVPVALDLGTVTLYRARSMQDPKQREHTLNEAKETFLAINSVAGESDQYRLYLGQTYYWLGQAGEGQKLFDELLAANKRSAGTLVTVAALLREVGAMGPARQLAEEAYAKGNTQQKYEAADMRALMYQDNEEQITWLKRANPADPVVVAQLSGAEAVTAMQENRVADALRLHLRAAEAYEKMPDAPASLNNAANEYFAAYAITADRTQRDKAAEKFQQALALAPSDSILLNNCAHTLMAAAAEDVMRSRFDAGRLNQQASLSLLYYVTTSPADRKQLGQALLANVSATEAMRDFDKLSVLRPKSAESYDTLLEIYGYVDDAAALKQLRQRVEAAQLDVDGEVSLAKAELSGARDQKDDAENAQALSFFRDHLARLNGPNDGAARAIGRLSMAALMVGSARHGGAVDLSQALALATSGEHDLPSRSASLILAGVYFYKGMRSVAAAEPGFGAWFKAHERHLDPPAVLALAAGNPAFRPALLANADVRKGIDVVAQSWQRVHLPSSADWKLLEAAGHPAADELASAIRGDEGYQQEAAIGYLLHPASQSAALQAIWADQARGDEAGAAAVGKQLQGLGIELPST
jgi:hypothetical protein